MNWLKGLGISVKVAVGAFLMALTVMAYQREKGKVRKWQQTAIDVENENVNTGTTTAKAANTQANLHDNQAKIIKKRAKAHIKSMGGQDEDVKSILSQFRSSS